MGELAHPLKHSKLSCITNHMDENRKLGISEQTGIILTTGDVEEFALGNS